MNSVPSAPAPAPGGTFADRIKLLIQRVGGPTEIARRCGFSEGVVRSWRDGNTDPSRARCVTLARTLGISLAWLVAGDGAILPEVEPSGASEQTSHETPDRPRPGAARLSEAMGTAMDAQRLDAALRILQSELELAGHALLPADHGELLAGLYEALDPEGYRVDTAALLLFNHRLADRIRSARAERGG